MKWVAYTDGGCAPSNPGPAGWGVVLIAPDGVTESDHYGFIGPGTNQIAELTAAIEGLSRVHRHQRVYAALGERMRAEIHALSMKTLTPAEWVANG